MFYFVSQLFVKKLSYSFIIDTVTQGVWLNYLLDYFEP